MELVLTKLSDVFETPALMLVILSMDECSRFRVYWRWLFTDFMDWIVREGSECENNDFFCACHDTFTDIIN